jgi:curved DNA-binding protein CbpA
MKDYYKILGVKSTASAEDVHARWIKLMRKLHPDRGTKGGVEDERVREINEAYGVLKDPSSRGQYDLRRAYQRKKRNLHLQRVVVPPVILIALFILGMIYLQRHRFAPLAKPKNPPVQRLNQIKTKLPIKETNEINQIDQIDESNQKNEFDQTHESNERKQFNQVNATEKNQKPVLRAKPLPKIQESVRSQTREGKEVNPTNPKNITNMKNRANSTNPNNPPNSKNSTNPVDLKKEIEPTSVPKDRKTSPLFAKSAMSVKTKNPAVPSRLPNRTLGNRQAKKETNLKNSTNQTNTTNPINTIDSRNSRTQINKSNKLNQDHVLAALKVSTEPNDINPINEGNKKVKAKGKSRINLINQMNPFIAQLKEPSLIATEGEVENFFAEYRERYARKDLEGLFSLFSSRAVENGRLGFEEMKKIYSDFFDKSEELRYQMEDTRIQIFQNAVEVWCLYKIEQTAKKGGKENVWWGDIRWILIRENGNLKVRFLDYKPRGSE